MRKFACCFLAVIFLFNNTVFAETPDLHEIIENFAARNQDTTAAVSIGVFTSHDVLFEQNLGYIDIAGRVVNDSNAVFERAVSKLLVSVSAMQLAEQGLLDLDADIRDILPYGFLTKLSYDDPITMLHLLNHTAGF